ncbi:MAG: glycosyltransferase family 4 protein [Methanosarcinaceae archaeon]|nr:glycosyltransferase family 4 protein [Methanosarcinaceae archaeon]
MVKRGHILFIVENNAVPDDPRVWKEALAAREFGYDVSVICPSSRNQYDRRNIIHGIQIYRHPRPIEGLGKWSMLLEYLTAFFWESWLAIRVFLTRPFAVIHGANPPDHIFLVALIFKIVGVKFVFDHHDLTPEVYVAKYGAQSIIHKILLWMERLTFCTADLVVSTNESYKKIALKRGKKAEGDIIVVRNGPDLSTIPVVSPNPGLLGGFRNMIGYVGNIGHQEGIENLLEAVSYIVNKKKRSEIKFAIVGTGPHLKNLIRQAKAMGLEKYVEFFGFVPDKLLYEILTTSDICVNPEFRNDFTDKSTMIKIMEYMSFKKPIVQFYTTESEFTAGGAAISIRSNDVVQFADAILALLDDPARRAEMGEIGRGRIDALLSWQLQKEKLRTVYDRVLSKPLFS